MRTLRASKIPANPKYFKSHHRRPSLLQFRSKLHLQPCPRAPSPLPSPATLSTTLIKYKTNAALADTALLVTVNANAVV
ncbi:hypothetical protein R3P38DRAFT_3218695 [Favolaschia claudopus]|uniref:Uncharacterized protein n=1 Tax=Favolaschia claudopus TaxID=2862362 RepID=A0AAW0A413_9AGAR